LKKFVVASAIALVALLALVNATVNGSPSDKVTICHAAGQAGTTKFVTLTISENAVYGRHGNAGHFNENGTTRAGHEQDYFGPCLTPTSSPTVAPSASITVTPTPSLNPSSQPTPMASPSISPSPSESPTTSPTESLTPIPNVDLTPPPTDTETDKAVAFAANAVGVYLIASLLFGGLVAIIALAMFRQNRNLF
jgi:hypothetical protein